jgi:septal ring factor EnvC (AmiA/AmiB activator)
MNEQDRSKQLWPTYALRAWLAALVAQVRAFRGEVESQIAHFEHEIARLRRQLERSEEVTRALNEVIDLVDDRLRRVRDSESYAAPQEHAAESHAEGHGREDGPNAPGKEPGPRAPGKPGGRPGNH